MRLRIAASTILAALMLTGCSANEPEPQLERMKGKETSSITQLPTINGGCEKGFDIYSQNQFSVIVDGEEAWGTTVSDSPSTDGARSAELKGNDKLRSTGWFRAGGSVYPKNPDRIRGEVWFYIANFKGGKAVWISDAGARAVETTRAPGNPDEAYDVETQAAPLPPECELTLR